MHPKTFTKSTMRYYCNRTIEEEYVVRAEEDFLCCYHHYYYYIIITITAKRVHELGRKYGHKQRHSTTVTQLKITKLLMLEKKEKEERKRSNSNSLRAHTSLHLVRA